jgi:hypothetical protein
LEIASTGLENPMDEWVCVPCTLQETHQSQRTLIKDDQIEYDSEMNPIGVSGVHTPFPLYHEKYRKRTEIMVLATDPITMV